MTALLVSSIFFEQEVFADTKTHNVFITTGSQQLGPASIEIKYDVSFDLSRPSSAQPDDLVTVEITPKTGKLSLTVNVAGETHTISRDVPLGSDVSLDVAPGIEVYVSTSASSIVNIEGPTDKNQQDIVWSGSNTQRMQFSVSDNAQQGDYVKITIPISIDLNVGLNLDLLLFKHNIGQIQFGSFQAQPVIEEIIPIGSTLGSDVIIIIIIIAAAATGGGIFMYLRKKRVVKKTQTCKKCGTVLALSSKFCAKCGNKI